MASQYGSSAHTASRSSPVSRSEWSVEATSEESAGCDVVPAIEAVAASTASTPASIAASRVRELAAGGVVGVQVHRQVEALAQRGDEGARGRGAQQARHVLDREHVRAGVDDALGEAEVVVERVELLVGAGQVAGVAERDLRDRRTGLAHRLDRRPHLLDVVEGVEDAEDVDAGLGGLGDEGVGDLGRVRRVADGVAAAQQHLQADVRHRLAQLGEPVPGVLGEEAQRHVVRRAAPGLEAEQLRRHPRDVAGDRQQVAGAHPRREQRLVRVAERRVGDARPAAARAGRRRTLSGPS